METVKDGDWIVERTPYGIHSRKAIRITAQLIFCQADWNPDRTRRVRHRDVIFAGAEKAAKLVADKLQSSQALAAQEADKVRERQRERDANIVAHAKASKAALEAA